MGLNIVSKIRKIKEYKIRIKVTNRFSEVYKKKKLILTKEQIKEAKEYWKPYLKLRKRDILCIDWYTRMNDEFSPSYIPAHLLYHKIIPAINDVSFALAFQQKGYVDLTIPGIKHPHNVISRISNIFYTDGLEYYGKNFPINFLKDNTDYLYKPQKNSWSGHNIFIFKKSEINKYKVQLSSSDYLIQEVIKPLPEFLKLSPRLTTFRVYTLFHNGKVDVLNVIYRIGTNKDSAVDNWTSGGIPVVVLENGKTCEYGVMMNLKDRKYSYFKDGNEILLKDIILPDIKPIIDSAINLAKKYPQLAFVGWDLCLNENNELILIEANMSNSDAFLLHMHPRYKEVLGSFQKDMLQKAFKNSHF